MLSHRNDLEDDDMVVDEGENGDVGYEEDEPVNSSPPNDEIGSALHSAFTEVDEQGISEEAEDNQHGGTTTQEE